MKYFAVADENGSFEVKVIQASREYEAEAVSGELYGSVSDFKAEPGATLLIALQKVLRLHNEAALAGSADDYDRIILSLTRESGFNAVVLPFEVSLDEIESIFGAGSKVYEFANRTGNTAIFVPTELQAVPAGTPVLVDATAEAAEVELDARVVSNEITEIERNGLILSGTFKPSDKSADWTLLHAGNWVETAAEAGIDTYSLADEAEAQRVPTCTAFIKSTEPDAVISFATQDSSVGIGSVEIETEDDAYYNLQGIRVINPTPGIYIHKGRKVVIR